jgi:diketogulonate reductase-like aldo/keto reductase
VTIKHFLASDAGKAAGLTRDDIWFTNKLETNSTYDAARKGIEQSLKASGLDHIDVFLLHSPYGDKQARLDTWRAVEDAMAEDDVKAGG